MPKFPIHETSHDSTSEIEQTSRNRSMVIGFLRMHSIIILSPWKDCDSRRNRHSVVLGFQSSAIGYCGPKVAMDTGVVPHKVGDPAVNPFKNE